MNHLAIICDGNRRWARANGLPVQAGHVQGSLTIDTCCCWAISKGIEYLTVYIFSTENWKRSKDEVDGLMNLFREYFGQRLAWYQAQGVRVRFLGRKDRVPQDLRELMERMEQETADCSTMTLLACVDYGGRDEIVRAVERGARTENEITAAIAGDIPAPDAILRTGGERRLSNFLLWQSAYSELLFRDFMFPDLNENELDGVLAEYESRNRRFGK